jgi:polysaccharide deacetylase 2 family uncharacterized protein YibQ
VSADDLTAPLGQDQGSKRRRALPVAIPRAVAAVLSLFVMAVAGWAMLADDPFGGEPMAVASANLATAAKPDAAGGRAGGAATSERPNRYDGPSGEAPGTPAGRTITIIDGTSGKRRDVVIPSPDGKPGNDQRASDGSAPNTLAPTAAPSGAPQLGGPPPKAVAAEPGRPSELYARPAKAIPGKPDAPRIAIVVGGLGVGGAATGDALGKLPGAVTLAFTPYGGGLDQFAARARTEGHELLLQLPMEPFDYPDNDPGPQTLLTSLDAAQNSDRLQWLLGRFQGYVGVANFMGARFTASENSLAPILREIGKRGLIYLDDGSSQRSLAGQIAGASNLGFAKADLTIDAVPAPAEVERALSRLEAIARERGSAVGVASAMPVAVDRIAKWAKAAEGRGLLLVPISAIAAQRKADDARLTQVR